VVRFNNQQFINYTISLLSDPENTQVNESTKGDVKQSNCLHVDFLYAMHNRKISVYF